MKDPRSILVEAARQFYQLGWMLGTAGNLSIRSTEDSFWITASGKNKGDLSENDFVRVDLNARVLDRVVEGNRPSAETSIHRVIYSLYPNAGACYHVHSIEANLVSHFGEGDYLILPPLEMIKGLGIWVENPRVKLPLFKNYLDVPSIAREIETRLQQSPPEVPALLITDHGVTVWGDTPEITRNHLEIVEYIFRYIVASRSVGYKF